MQAVEAGGQVEHRAVAVGVDLDALVRPGCGTRSTWPSTKIRPITKVSVNQRRSACTSPCSAANTPSWQVTEESTRITVNVSRVRDVEDLGVLLPLRWQSAARIEKYIANSAAKNMSSLESHTIVPTLTMLGRVSEWIRLLSMAGAAVTRSLLPRDQRRRVAGWPNPAVSWPGGALRPGRWPSLQGVLPRPIVPPTRRRGDRAGHRAPAAVHRRADLHRRPAWTAGWPSCWCSPPALYLYGVHRLRRRGDRWPVAPHGASSSAAGSARSPR